MAGGGGGGEKTRPNVHCHRQNDSCIKMGSSVSHLNVSFIVMCPQTTTGKPQQQQKGGGGGGGRESRSEESNQRRPPSPLVQTLPNHFCCFFACFWKYVWVVVVVWFVSFCCMQLRLVEPPVYC